MTTEPSTPSDTPLSDVTRALDARLGDGQFTTAPDAAIRCLTCRATFPAADVSADAMTRLEGASDPSDMLMVIPVTCPRCGAAGPLILNYGAETSADEADVILAMSRSHESSADGDSAVRRP